MTKEIRTISELIRFTDGLKVYGINIPENMIIVSPELVSEAIDWMNGHEFTNIFKTATGVEIYGVKVVRDYAEVIDVT